MVSASRFATSKVGTGEMTKIRYGKDAPDCANQSVVHIESGTAAVPVPDGCIVEET